MAKSKIIKDLANGEVDTMTALKRAKVLISELQDNELLNWINQEISGYLIEATLPDYRIDEGNLLGSYLKGSMAAHMKYSNVSLPLGKMPDDLRSKLSTLQFREGIEALKSLLESAKTDKDGQIGKIIPADFFGVISTYNKDPYMIITSAKVVIGVQHIQNIFSVIENMLLDILLLLEKEFGSLDELDIDVSCKTAEELQSISKEMHVLIYNDYSVKVGDNNKIKESSIASAKKS